MSKRLNLHQYGKVTLQDLSLNGDASFNNDVFISNNLVTNNDILCNNRLFILGDISLNSNIYVQETFIVDGDASLNANLLVSNDTTLNKRLFVSDDVSLNKRLFVSDDVSLNGDLYIKEMLLVNNDASLNANLKVSNDATLNNRLFVSNDASFNNDVFISNNLVTNNDIQCNNRLFVLGDVSWNPNNLADDCIPSTAIIGGAGGSSSFSANGDDIYYNNGNVGIGTTSPDVPFEVIGNQNITNPNQSDLQNVIAKFTANDVAGVVVGSINGNTPYIADCNGSSQNSTGLRFLTNSTTRMTISTAGNIGIGTTSPTYTMDIRGDLKLSGDIRITQTYAANGVSKRIVFGVNYNNQGFGEYTIAHVTGNSGAEWNNSHLRFSTPGSTNALTIKQNGAVGININATKAMFEIYGTVTYNMWGRWYNKDGNNGWQNANRTLSLYAHSHMACAELHVWSDRRIKKNISEVPDNLSLQIIRDLPVKYYHHIDELTKGPHQVIGFIAQEVKELLPNCVHIGPNVIPDEYRFLEDFTWEETTDNKFKLKCDLQDCSGVSYVFQAANNLEEKAKDITVVGNEDNTFTFDKKYSLLFLYGREVDDFHYIDESQIYAVGISALQEVDKQQQADKAKIATLETQVASLETQLTDVLSRLAALENA